MAEEQKQDEPTIQLTQPELVEFINMLRETLVGSITENNAQAMVALFDRVMPPFIERLDQIAMAQITLAQALKTNRRDANATRFAELLIERAMRTPEGIDKDALQIIPSMAYALADEMDLYGRVAEVQAEDKGKRMDAAAAEAPKFASAKDLVDKFLNRRVEVPAPKVDLPVPKVPAKKSKGH